MTHDESHAIIIIKIKRHHQLCHLYKIQVWHISMSVTPCYVRPWDRGGQIRRVNTANYLVVQTVHQGRDVDF